jgi:nicotinamidase-related amidase
MDDYTRPNPDRAALLTIDVQNDFTRPDAPATIDGDRSRTSPDGTAGRGFSRR